jgi:hypothetical protein
MTRHLLLVTAISALLIVCPQTIAQAGAGAGKGKQPSTYTIPLPSQPDFSALDWLIGDWAGPTTGRGTPGDVHLTLSYMLDKRFVLIREEVSLPASQAAPALHETWMGFLGANPSGPGFVLHAFSSTGFILRYHVSASQDQVRFDPEGGANPPPGWLFRREITKLGPGFFSETVSVAPPGAAFFEYYSAKLTQVIVPKSSLAAPVP